MAKKSVAKPSDGLWQYFLLTYAAVLVNASGYLHSIEFDGIITMFFALAVYLTYCLMYMLPMIVLVLILDAGLSWSWFDPRTRRARSVALYGLAVVGFTLVQIFIFADGFIFRLYGFHFNGFVWNLILTEGGIESLGGSGWAVATFSLIAAGFLAIQAGLLVAVLRVRLPRRVRRFVPIKHVAAVTVAIAISATLSERVTYGACKLLNYSPVLMAANAFPFYQPMTYSTLAKKMGFVPSRQTSFRLKAGSGQIHYPAKPIERTASPHYNIVWLVSESLRADMLDPEIMPDTWAFSKQAVSFSQHYSGGNGTRMGLFSMFYGLYGSYWFPFLNEQRGPLIMDLLLKDQYQISLYTSARFTYPEFDSTLFARIPLDQMHARDTSLTNWQNDRHHVTELLDFIGHRDPSRPFMTFLFFESPHARYYFPPESVIRRPYLKNLNYATMDVNKDMPLIKNRYINSCHHLDSQLGRVITYLKENNLLDSTIVLITGDHGEEFMEKGRWGHNSAFSEEQTRVPMVLWVPGQPAGRVSRMTSHLDIPATLLPLLGVTNPPEDYSLGFNLLGTKEREYTMIADWSTLTYVDPQCKVTFPLTAASWVLGQRVTTKDDAPIAKEIAFSQANRHRFINIMSQLKKFSR